MLIDPKIFKDYDLRAIIPSQLDEEGMYHLGLAFAWFFKAKTIAVGRDMRTSADTIFNQLTRALTDVGVNVIDLGLITTDMSYFASATLKVDAAIMITASHNPAEYNGYKLVRKNAVAVSGDSGIYEIRNIALSQQNLLTPTASKGSIVSHDLWPAWVKHSLSFIDINKISPLKVMVDAGNGMASWLINKLEPILPVKFDKLYFDLDGTFPNHQAYPLVLDNTKELRKQVVEKGYDLGVAWDGDGDRMFLIDDQGQFADGTAFGAMLADYLLTKAEKNSKVIYNAVIGAVVKEIIEKHHGTPIRWRVGHAFLKEKMREEDALLAVEHSGHFFFQENYHCDAGSIAFLFALEIISESKIKLSELLKTYRKYPNSGEINFKVVDKEAMMKLAEAKYGKIAQSVDWIDGVTLWFAGWWFNFRPSNTQPLLRLNIEITDPTLNIKDKVTELQKFVESNPSGGPMVNE